MGGLQTCKEKESERRLYEGATLHTIPINRGAGANKFLARIYSLLTMSIFSVATSEKLIREGDLVILYMVLIHVGCRDSHLNSL